MILLFRVFCTCCERMSCTFGEISLAPIASFHGVKLLRKCRMTKQLRLKFVQYPDDCIHFFFSKRLVERNAQFFGVYLLGDRQL